MPILPLDIIASTYLLLTMVILPCGYSAFRLLGKNITRSNLAPSILFILSLGLAIAVPIWWIVSLIRFGAIEFLVSPLIAAVAMFLARSILISKGMLEANPNALKEGKWDTKENLVFLIAGAFCFLYLASVTSYLSWPQIGDPWFHGRYILTIIDQEKLPIDFLPFDTAAMTYPLGFHLPVAGICMITGQVPGTAMIIFAAFTLSLLCFLPARLVYQSTESASYSAMTLFLFFFIHPVSYAQNSIYFNFLNGTFPIELGLLILFTLMLMMSERNSVSNLEKLIEIFIIAVMTGALFITYPSFILVSGLVLLMFYGRYIIELVLARKRSTRVRLGTWIALVIAVIVGAIFIATGPFAYIFSNLSWDRTPYMLLPERYFDSSITIPITLLAIIGAILEYSKSKRAHSALYLLLMFAVLASMVPGWFYLGLELLLPTRMMLFLQLWSYVYLFTFVVYFESGLHSAFLSRKRTPPISPTVYRSIVVGLILLVMSPTSAALVTNSANQRASWFIGSDLFHDDQEGGYFIRNNLQYGVLVLNDQTQSDWFLPAMGIPNVIYTRPQSNESLTRALALEDFWSHPENETLVRLLLDAYDVRVVYLSSQKTIRRLVIWNTTFINRPYQAYEYRAIFDGYSFLIEVFNIGNCSVYQVTL